MKQVQVWSVGGCGWGCGAASGSALSFSSGDGYI